MIWKKKGAEAPCEECMPELLPENEEIIQVWQRVENQVITTGERHDVVDLDLKAVKIAMDLYGIKDQKGCDKRVVKLFHHFLEQDRMVRNLVK